MISRAELSLDARPMANPDFSISNNVWTRNHACRLANLFRHFCIIFSRPAKNRSRSGCGFLPALGSDDVTRLTHHGNLIKDGALLFSDINSRLGSVGPTLGKVQTLVSTQITHETTDSLWIFILWHTSSQSVFGGCVFRWASSSCGMMRQSQHRVMVNRERKNL